MTKWESINKAKKYKLPRYLPVSYQRQLKRKLKRSKTKDERTN